MLALIDNLIPSVPLKWSSDEATSLHRALQWGIMLEHALIPPYLYALYSLKPDGNREVAKRLRSIVQEEMLHMTLACNILNAIDGSPKIDKKEHATKHPRHIPGTSASSPDMQLSACSLLLVQTCFKPIESPVEPIHYLTPKPVPSLPPMPVPGGQTVGEFYNAIAGMIKVAGDDIFTGDRKRQIVEGFDKIIPVHNVDTALRAINLIVEQGEAPPSGDDAGPFGPDGKLSHFYAFDEITKGYALVPNPASCPSSPPSHKFHFNGGPVTLNPDGIWPVPTNPNAEHYEKGSAARRVIDTFNYTYTALLKALDHMVNGHPKDFAKAFGLMFSLQEQAMGMMSGDAVPGKQNVGPTFEYLADNK